MNALSFVLLALILVAAVLAVRYALRHHLLGGCGGDCTRCDASCARRKGK